MAAHFYRAGKKIEYTVVETPVEYHVPIMIGKLMAIPSMSAEIGQTISCDVVGVFKMDKKTGDVINQGQAVYLTEGKITATGTIPVGIAWAAAGAEASVVEVNINVVAPVAG